MGCWRRPTLYERREGRKVDIGTLLIHEKDGSLTLHNPLKQWSISLSAL